MTTIPEKDRRNMLQDSRIRFEFRQRAPDLQSEAFGVMRVEDTALMPPLTVEMRLSRELINERGIDRAIAYLDNLHPSDLRAITLPSLEAQKAVEDATHQDALAEAIRQNRGGLLVGDLAYWSGLLTLFLGPQDPTLPMLSTFAGVGLKAHYQPDLEHIGPSRLKGLLSLLAPSFLLASNRKMARKALEEKRKAVKDAGQAFMEELENRLPSNSINPIIHVDPLLVSDSVRFAMQRVLLDLGGHPTESAVTTAAKNFAKPTARGITLCKQAFGNGRDHTRPAVVFTLDNMPGLLQSFVNRYHHRDRGNRMSSERAFRNALPHFLRMFDRALLEQHASIRNCRLIIQNPDGKAWNDSALFDLANFDDKQVAALAHQLANSEHWPILVVQPVDRLPEALLPREGIRLVPKPKLEGEA